VLARNDLRVLVCDPRPLPIDKPCGEGVLPTGVRHLEQLGALENVDGAEVHPFVGIRVHTASGLTASAAFAEGPGLGIRRVNLSRALLRTAQRNNLEIQQNAFKSMNLTAQGMDVELRDRRVNARLVIGADGLNSRVRRCAGLEGGKGSFRRLGARQHYRISPWSDCVEVVHGHGIEAYITPCGQDLTDVAFLWDPGRYQVETGARMITSLLRAFPDLEARLRHAPLEGAPMATGPLHRLALGRVADGVLLTGDAGGYLDACTGEGISLALAQALAMEDTVVPELRKPGDVLRSGQLRAFERAARNITQPYLLATRFLLFLNRRPALFDRFIRAVRTYPDILQHFFSAQMGCASFVMGWSKLLHLVHGLAMPGGRT
jgi:2-polyprenyl-6-methoxyphenol hydroxylase-like FAD-dependent oxidoreductase